jgi:hypothetical protein
LDQPGARRKRILERNRGRDHHGVSGGRISRD